MFIKQKVELISVKKSLKNKEKDNSKIAGEKEPSHKKAKKKPKLVEVMGQEDAERFISLSAHKSAILCQLHQ